MDNVFPALGNGLTLDKLKAMEGAYAFRCADCEEIFQTVLEWANHALEEHGDGYPGVEPVRKQ